MNRKLLAKTFWGLAILMVLVINSCSHNPRLYEKYYGICIDHSLRQGAFYRDSTGIKYWCFYVRTVITNDSSVSAHVKLNFPKEFYHTNFSDSEKYKIFLLSEKMAEEKDSTGYYLVSGKLNKFFDSGLESPFILDTVLKPKAACTVYIGLITKEATGIGAYLSLLSKGHKPHFWPSKAKFGGRAPSDSALSIPDSAITKFIVPTEKQLSLFLGVRIIYPRFGNDPPPLNYYNIIPCGQVSYSN